MRVTGCLNTITGRTTEARKLDDNDRMKVVKLLLDDGHDCTLLVREGSLVGRTAFC